MNEFEIKQLWQKYSKTIENSPIINNDEFKQIQKNKLITILSPAKTTKILIIIFGIIWVIFVDFLILNSLSFTNIFFIVSATIHSLITKIAIGIYVYHLILLKKIDASFSVIEVQEQLASIQTSAMQITRLLFLQFPLFTTFYLRFEMFQNGNVSLWIWQVSNTILFTLAAIWLFKNINKSNMNKWWFGFIFRGKEWDSVSNALAFLTDIQEFRDEKTGGTASETNF